MALLISLVGWGTSRIVGLQPNKMMGVVGEHGELPIEGMALSRDNRFLATWSHDWCIKFWNVAYLYEDDGGDNEAEEEEADEAAEEEEEEADDSSTVGPGLGMQIEDDAAGGGDTAGNAAGANAMETESAAAPKKKKRKRGGFYSGLK